MIRCIVSAKPSGGRPGQDCSFEDAAARVWVECEASGAGQALVRSGERRAALVEGIVYGLPSGASAAEEALRVYASKGRAGLGAMRGEYALVLYDGHTQELIALGDSAGAVSLFFEQSPRKIEVTTSLGRLRANRGAADLDMAFAATHLLSGRRPAGRTPFRGISRLRPGHGLRWDAASRRTHIWRYWWPVPCRTLDPDACPGAILNSVTAALADRLESLPGPAAVCLSGGLDSSCVYAVAARILGEPPLAVHFVWTDPNCGEVEYAQAVADHYGGQLVVADAGSTWPFRGFPRWPRTEEPSDAIAHGLGELVRSATEGHGVALLLDGDGGDQLFDAVRGVVFPDSVSWRHPFAAVREFRRQARQADLSYADTVRQLLIWPLVELPRALWQPPAYATPLARRSYEPPRLRGRGCTQRLLEMQLLHARPRVPFPGAGPTSSPLLDPRVIEAAAAVRGLLKWRDGRHKIVLREALRPYLPEGVVMRTKSSNYLSYFTRGFRREWPALAKHFQTARIYDTGMVDRTGFLRALSSLRGGSVQDLAGIMRVMCWEAWLTGIEEAAPPGGSAWSTE